MLIVNARLKNAIEQAITEYKMILLKKNRALPYFRQNDIEEIEEFLSNDITTSDLYFHVLKKKNELRTGGVFNVISQHSKLKRCLTIHVFDEKTAGFSLSDLMDEDIQSVQIRSSTCAILNGIDAAASEIDVKKNLKIDSLSQELGLAKQELASTKQDCIRLKELNALLLKRNADLQSELDELSENPSSTDTSHARSGLMRAFQ